VSLANDLLEQAVKLASADRGRPRQASLRRAISTAYYSLFHLIVEDAVQYPVSTATLRPAVARTFEHKDLKNAAKAIGDVHRGGNHWIKEHIRGQISNDLASVCDTLVDLQDQRHAADYDLSARFTRGHADSRLSTVIFAHIDWTSERRTHNARVFMLAAAGLLGHR
jgi:uncharacterized protein (UPF0332 family)